MQGFDNSTNIILTDSFIRYDNDSVIFRVFDTQDGCENVAIGLYILRGDSIAVVCGIDQERDEHIDWGSVKLSKEKSGIRAL